MNKKQKILKIQQSRKLLNLLTGLEQETKKTEKALAKQIRRFFTRLQRRIIKEYSEVSDEYLHLFHLQVPLIIEDEWGLYETILGRYNEKAAVIGILYNKLLTEYSFQRAREMGVSVKSDASDIYKANPKVSEGLRQNTVYASEKVKNKITSDINNVLSDAYNDGLGRNDVMKKLNEKFNKLGLYEAKQIAVTEINSNRNYANYEQIKNDCVEYKQWITAEDNRVRPTHVALNGHIVRTKDNFSNGLEHPGDKNGAVKEWINCRCVLLPYFVPWGMKAPDMVEFTEDQLLVDESAGTVSDHLS